VAFFGVRYKTSTHGKSGEMGNKFPAYSFAKDADVSEIPTFDLTDI
jgi:hypothetical protein